MVDLLSRTTASVVDVLSSTTRSLSKFPDNQSSTIPSSASVPVLISPLLTRKDIASKTYGKQCYQAPQQTPRLVTSSATTAHRPQASPRSSPSIIYTPRAIIQPPEPRSSSRVCRSPQFDYRGTQAAPASPYPSSRSSLPTYPYPASRSSPRFHAAARSVSPIVYPVIDARVKGARVFSRSPGSSTRSMQSCHPVLNTLQGKKVKPVYALEGMESDTTSEPKSSLMDTTSSLGSSKVEIETPEEAAWEDAKDSTDAGNSKDGIHPAAEEAACEDPKVAAVSGEVSLGTAEETQRRAWLDETDAEKNTTDAEKKDGLGVFNPLQIQALTPTSGAHALTPRPGIIDDIDWSKVDWDEFEDSLRRMYNLNRERCCPNLG